MSKFYGTVGYAETVETRPGIWEEQIIEHNYCGDMFLNTRKLQSADKVNDDITISNKVSIIADPYATEHFHAMRYVKYLGARWKVSSVEVQYPRLILTLGGVYNGKQT